MACFVLKKKKKNYVTTFFASVKAESNIRIASKVRSRLKRHNVQFSDLRSFPTEIGKLVDRLFRYNGRIYIERHNVRGSPYVPYFVRARHLKGTQQIVSKLMEKKWKKGGKQGRKDVSENVSLPLLLEQPSCNFGERNGTPGSHFSW